MTWSIVASMRDLTTTSYAILGMLAMRAASAYELTAEMRRSAIRDFWPRTESRLYAEPKNLLQHGLIAARTEHTGRRSRTVYRITQRGRRALRRWLGEPSAARKTEDETMLRIALAESGTRDQLLATIHREFEALHRRAETLAEIGGDFTGGRVRFPERLHIAAVLGRFTAADLRSRVEYLEWLEGWVRNWSGARLEDCPTGEVNAVVRENAREITRLRDRLARRTGRESAGTASGPSLRSEPPQL